MKPILVLAAALLLTLCMVGKAAVPDEFIDVTAVDDNPCVYQGKYLTINIEELGRYFVGMNVSDTTNHFIYFLSLCSPIVCSFSDSEKPKESSVCQYDNVAKNELFYNLGRTELSEFRMVNLSYFHITYGGGDPIHNGHGEVIGHRRAKVDFMVSKDGCNTPTVKYVGETRTGEDPMVHTYGFLVCFGMDEKVVTFN